MFGSTKTKSQKNIYEPLLASENLDGGIHSAEEIQTIWSKLVTLPSARKNILLSTELSEKLELLQRTFQADDVAIEGVSVLLRWFYFDEVDQAGFQGGLQDIFGDRAPKVLEFIQKEIFTLRPQPKEEEVEEEVRSKGEVVRMPLLQALSKYEQLGNQLITRERIKIKSQPEPVRPSLLYWIKYYRDELGIGHHSSVQRGDFLFRSENGKRLSPEERERVNVVLKSVEENMPLDIDTERSEILFPIFTTPERPVAQRMEPPMAPTLPPEKMQPRINPAFQFGQDSRGTNAPVAPTPAGEMSFTSKHVFPAEREAATPEMTPTTVPARAPVPGAQTIPRPNPFRIRPVSLGKHEE